MKASIIIPVYNEEEVISSCLESLSRQTFKDFEVIVVDDGSSDATVSKIQNSNTKIQNLALLRQEHLGPGAARNLGANKAKGEILVFVDADMEFEPDFLTKLTGPIRQGKVIGTYSSDERLLNRNNPWARCWNLNLGKKAESLEPRDYEKKNQLISYLSSRYKRVESRKNINVPSGKSRVFRAILKQKFEEAGGFEKGIGYTDDWSVSRKLGEFSTEVKDAPFYHNNPGTLQDVWKQARWFGKNEFLTGNLIRRLYNLIRYFPLAAPIKGLIGAILFKESIFVLFKTVYDTAVWTSVFLSFFGEAKSK